MIQALDTRYEGDLVKFQFDPSTALVICKSSYNSVAFALRAPVTPNEIQGVLEQLPFPTETMDILLAGPNDILNSVAVIFERLKISVKKKLPRDSGFQALFQAKSGNWKISRSSKPTNTTEEKIKVLIIEDSPTMQNILKKIFNSKPNFEVIGSLFSAEEVERSLQKNIPDVITLDLNLPGMSGVDLLKTNPLLKKIPTVLITSLNFNDGNKVFDALEAGAVDYIQKPSMEHMADQSLAILEKVEAAAKANMKVGTHKIQQKVSFSRTDIPIFIGSSTGGTTAIECIVKNFAPPIPPIAIVQHIPAHFSKSFADRLNELVPFTVKEAAEGDQFQQNCIYIAPGGQQMALQKKSGEYVIRINDDPPVNRFKPSVDYFFNTVVAQYKGPMVGIILTGMGRDGAAGLLKMKNMGGYTIAQSERTCVVYGMPKRAVEIGGTNSVADLHDIPSKIVQAVGSLKKSAA